MRLKSLALTTAFIGSIYAANAATTVGITYPVPADITDKSLPQFDSTTSIFNQISSRLQLPQNPTIVSIGTDTGRIASFFAQQHPNAQIISLAFNNDLMTFAQQHYQTPQVTFRQGDITQPQTSLNGQADLVFCSWLTPQIPQNQQRATLENIRTTLKNNGSVAVIAPMKGSTFSQALNAVASQPQWRKQFQGTKSDTAFFTPVEYSNLMKSAGFSNIQTETTAYQTQFPTRDDLRNFVFTSASRYLSHLDQTQTQQFVDAVTDEYIRRASAPSTGPIPFQVDLLVATGQNTGGQGSTGQASSRQGSTGQRS